MSFNKSFENQVESGFDADDDISQYPEQPSPFRMYDFEFIGDDLYFAKKIVKCDKKTGEQKIDRQYTRIGSALHVIAETRDENSEKWGKLLSWKDTENIIHELNMPMSLLPQAGNPWLILLLENGYRVCIEQIRLLKLYISETTSHNLVRCVQKVGWHGENFVFPNETVGDSQEKIVLQNASSTASAMYTQRGTLDGWKELAGLAVGNSRLAFAVSAAFAGPLLRLSGLESGGFNFVGASSTGKSTALRMAASVLGSPAHVKSWRITDNAAEGLAVLHNDSTLLLDELGQAIARAVAEMAYMLSNGSGKGRANRDGTARMVLTWSTLFLSTGEIGLADKLAEAGQKPKAGQEVRLVDVGADAGSGMGIFEDTHGMKPGELANRIKDLAARDYGHAGKLFIRHIIDGGDALGTRVREGVTKFVLDVCPEDADGQVKRVAARFGLVAVAGTMATEAGILPWPTLEAWWAAKTLFQSWINARGGSGAAEDAAILSELLGFLQKHGQSRFQSLEKDKDEDDFDQLVINRAGFKEENGNGATYYILDEPWKNEIFKGFNSKYAAKIAESEGLLVRTEGDKLKTRKVLPGLGKVNCYKIVLNA